MGEHEHGGEFSVRSSYQLIKQLEKETTVGENSGASVQRRFWNQLWKLQMPNKTKAFAWKTCKNGLPTRSNLRERGVLIDAKCPFCGTEEEDLYHAYFQCSRIRGI